MQKYTIMGFKGIYKDKSSATKIGILFLLIKYKVYFLWKIWFLFAIVLALTVSWGAFINSSYALVLALIAGFWRVFRPNIIVHNLTEIFVYGGLRQIKQGEAKTFNKKLCSYYR